MSETPINLNKARKARARAQRKQQADRNSALHGMPKAERARLQQADARWKAHVDGARRTSSGTSDEDP